MELKDVQHQSKTDTIRTALAEIKGTHPEGLLTAEAVVDAARHPDHPLHSFFTWDDTQAAEQWRLLQARGLIRKVRVLPSNDSDMPTVPKYVSLMSDRQREGGGYRETSDVLTDDDLLAELKATAAKELQGYLDRHACLTELCEKVASAASDAGVPVEPPKNRRKRSSRKE